MLVRLFPLFLLFGVVLAAPAAAQIDQRQANQQQRIDNGVASGTLTANEATRLQNQQTRIANTEDRMRASGGGLGYREGAYINARQNRASATIARKKRNARYN
jgi:hypothetical protein